MAAKAEMMARMVDGEGFKIVCLGIFAPFALRFEAHCIGSPSMPQDER
jgi:hypothetical protein